MNAKLSTLIVDKAQLSDGVYFIAGTSDSENNKKTYVKYEPGMTSAPIPAKYIGVKLGHRAIAVALEDLPGNKDRANRICLLPYVDRSPKDSVYYNEYPESVSKKGKEFRFNAFEDFDGKGNTARLKKYGCRIHIPEGEWIPSMGEFGLLMMHATEVNKAIELAGGQRLEERWHWSSTMSLKNNTWNVIFGNGQSHDVGNQLPALIRTVAEF